MSLRLEQIEHAFKGESSGARKWMKNQRNRKIRRSNKLEKPNIKYNGWEF
jgi:hypothetical protein